MLLKGLNHLAFITDDRPRRWLLPRCSRLVAGIGHDGYRHTSYRWPAARSPSSSTTSPTHGAQEVPRLADRRAVRLRSRGHDRRDQGRPVRPQGQAGGRRRRGDRGGRPRTMWSIYFFDPNNIPLEAAWDSWKCSRRRRSRTTTRWRSPPRAPTRSRASGPRSPVRRRRSRWSRTRATAAPCAKAWPGARQAGASGGAGARRAGRR